MGGGGRGGVGKKPLSVITSSMGNTCQCRQAITNYVTYLCRFVYLLCFSAKCLSVAVNATYQITGFEGLFVHVLIMIEVKVI